MELSETIEQKNRLVERMHGEIESSYGQDEPPVLPSHKISIKHACSY